MQKIEDEWNKDCAMCARPGFACAAGELAVEYHLVDRVTKGGALDVGHARQLGGQLLLGREVRPTLGPSSRLCRRRRPHRRRRRRYSRDALHHACTCHRHRRHI